MRVRWLSLWLAAIPLGACTFPDVDYADGGGGGTSSTGTSGSTTSTTTITSTCPLSQNCAKNAGNCADTARNQRNACVNKCKSGDTACVTACDKTMQSALAVCLAACTQCGSVDCGGAMPVGCDAIIYP